MNSIRYWNNVALEANRADFSKATSEQGGPTLSSRALAIVHLAMHDAFFGVANPTLPVTDRRNPFAPLPGGAPPPGTNSAAAVAAAACGALSAMFPSQRQTFEQRMLDAGIAPGGSSESGTYGRFVAVHIVGLLAVKPSEPGASDRGYAASFAPGRHRPDPDNPDQGFHAPFYGATAKRIAVTSNHTLNAHPPLASAAYREALREVYRQGGAATLESTRRNAAGTLIGHYWAYDGANQIGTPPRLYNQILRVLSESNGNSEADDARLFALANAAMGDCGILAWADKYRYDLWRPVLGVREHDTGMGPTGVGDHAISSDCDPFWLPLGAPRTNTTQKSFTPPFPAYPSGHATFGAGAFQIARRFYKDKLNLPFDPRKADTLGFEFVSDELNGVSTNERGTVHSRHVRKFDSLWQAIFENGLSRVYLGVHWIFDAFDASDVRSGNGFKSADTIEYTQNVGGVRLGLDIADDIYDNGLVLSPL